MNFNDEFILNLALTLPEQCGPEDLVNAGIFESAQQVMSAIRTARAPDYFVLPTRGYVFLKPSVIEFMRRCSQSGTQPQKMRVRKKNAEKPSI